MVVEPDIFMQRVSQILIIIRYSLRVCLLTLPSQSQAPASSFSCDVSGRKLCFFMCFSSLRFQRKGDSSMNEQVGENRNNDKVEFLLFFLLVFYVTGRVTPFPILTPATGRQGRGLTHSHKHTHCIIYPGHLLPLRSWVFIGQACHSHMSQSALLLIVCVCVCVRVVTTVDTIGEGYRTLMPTRSQGRRKAQVLTSCVNQRRVH